MTPQEDSAQKQPESKPAESTAAASPDQVGRTEVPAPEVEATFPTAAAPAVEPANGNPTPVGSPGNRSRYLRIGLAIVFVFVLGLSNFGSYLYGSHRGRTEQSAAARTSASETALQVPKGATIIEQCAVGRGTQYVLPSNIPHGPVFNVYKGKVIGLEYMIGKDDLANAKTFFNLPLYGKKYDHIDIGLLSKGHAGYPVPHYHVDVYDISHAASKAITCK